MPRTRTHPNFEKLVPLDLLLRLRTGAVRRSHPRLEKPVQVEWQDSAWLPRVIVRAGPAAAVAHEGRVRPEQSAARLRLPRLRFFPQTVFAPAHARTKTSPPHDRPGVAGRGPRITYNSWRANSP